MEKLLTGRLLYLNAFRVFALGRHIWYHLLNKYLPSFQIGHFFNNFPRANMPVFHNNEKVSKRPILVYYSQKLRVISTLIMFYAGTHRSPVRIPSTPKYNKSMNIPTRSIFC